MANLRISELVQRTPNGAEFLEVIIPPFIPGTNRKVLLSDLVVLGFGVTREFNRAFSEELLFDKNEIYVVSENVTSDLNYTVAALGNLVNQSSTIRQTLVMDGVSSINFGAGFDNLYGITDGQVLTAGTYDIWFVYTNGSVSVSLPGGDPSGFQNPLTGDFVWDVSTHNLSIGGVGTVSLFSDNGTNAASSAVFSPGQAQITGGTNNGDQSNIYFAAAMTIESIDASGSSLYGNQIVLDSNGIEFRSEESTVAPSAVMRINVDQTWQVIVIPTSSAGLASGTIWANSNVLTRVP